MGLADAGFKQPERNRSRWRLFCCRFLRGQRHHDLQPGLHPSPSKPVRPQISKNSAKECYPTPVFRPGQGNLRPVWELARGGSSGCGTGRAFRSAANLPKQSLAREFFIQRSFRTRCSPTNRWPWVSLLGCSLRRLLLHQRVLPRVRTCCLEGAPAFKPAKEGAVSQLSGILRQKFTCCRPRLAWPLHRDGPVRAKRRSC